MLMIWTIALAILDTMPEPRLCKACATGGEVIELGKIVVKLAASGTDTDGVVIGGMLVGAERGETEIGGTTGDVCQASGQQRGRSAPYRAEGIWRKRSDMRER